MDLFDLFKQYLFSQKDVPTKVTVKNYLSDVNHFVHWYENTFVKKFDPKIISGQTLNNYRAACAGIFSPSSLERHLSSLRKFFKFLLAEGKIPLNPFEVKDLKPKIEHDPWHIRDFKDFLYVCNASRLTIKNYLIDIKQFLVWAEEVSVSDTAGAASLNVLARIDSELVEEYKQRLLTQGNFSPATINRKLSSLRRYLSWAQSQNLKEQNPLIAQPVEPKAEGISAKYSSFPPIRTIQKISEVFIFVLDQSFFIHLAKLADKLEYALWHTKGKPVFAKIKTSTPSFRRQASSVKNLPKQFYAPLEISTKLFPWYKKAWFTARYSRPKWYKTYHSYPIAHYLNFAVLIIFLGIISFNFYNVFFEKGNQSPTLAAGGTTPVAPPRVLSFQGRLTDNFDTPISTPSALRFMIYDSLTASESGSHRLWEEVDNVTPDQDGIFNVILGNGAVCNGGNPPATPATGSCAIPQSLFANNAALWLGVTVGDTSELTPRQQLATVAYATNAELLQGMAPTTSAPSAYTNTVLALDGTAGSPTLTIGGSVGTTFQATGGEFQIYGKSLLLGTTANSGGNVAIAPDGLGFVDVRRPLINTTNNNNLAGVAGAVEVDDMFAVLATSSVQSAVTINQNGGGLLLNASAGGITKFMVDSAGSATIAGHLVLSNPAAKTTFGGIAYAWPGTISSNGYVLSTQTNGQLSWIAQTTGGVQFWQELSGALSPSNTGDDLLLGASSTSSAAFAFTGLMGHQTQASLSGQLIVTPNNGYGGGIQLGSTINNNNVLNTSAQSGAPSGNLYWGNRQLVDSTNIGSFGVSSVTNSDGTLTISPTTGAVVASLNLGNANSWSGAQTFGANTYFPGSGIWNTSGNVGIGTASPLAALDVRGISSTGPVASVSGSTSFASLVVNNNGSGDLLTASASGWTRFRIDNNGGLTTTGTTTFNGLTYTWPASIADNNYVLRTQTNGTLAWVPANSIGTNFWQDIAGALSPIQASDDLLLGASSTSSAAFAFTGLMGHQTQASFSGQLIVMPNLGWGGKVGIGYNDAGTAALAVNGNVGIGTNTPTALLDVAGQASVGGILKFRSGTAQIQATADQTLTLGGDTTGQIVLNGFNGAVNGITFGGYNTCTLKTTAAGVVTCGTDLTGSTVNSPFAEITGVNGGIIVANNTTEDFLLGAQSTASAVFAFTGLSSPTHQTQASLSGKLVVMPNNGWGGVNIGYNGTGTGALAVNGNVGIGTTSPTALLNIDGGYGSNAALIINQLNSGNLLTASASGVTKFVIQNDGKILAPFYATCTLKTDSTGLVTCGTDLTGSGAQFWQELAGALSPVQLGDDLLLGGSSTASAKFAFINANGTGNPTASISGNLSLVVPAGSNPLAQFNILNGGSLNFQTSVGGDSGLTSALYIANNGNIGIGNPSPQAKLDIGGAASTISNTSGDITITPAGNLIVSSGKVGIGTTSPLATLDLRGNSGTTPVASVSGRTSFAGLVVDNQGPGDLIVASSSAHGGSWGDGEPARTEFRVTNAGDVYGRTWHDLDNSVYFMDLNSATTSLLAAGAVGIGTTSPRSPLDVLSTAGTQLRLTYTDNSVYTTFNTDSSGNLTIAPTGTSIIFSGTTTITASSLATFTTAATLAMGSTTTLNLGGTGNATINGSTAANGDLTLQGTTNATRTTSYVLIQPTAGLVGIGTTTPASKLAVGGNGNSTYTIYAATPSNSSINTAIYGDGTAGTGNTTGVYGVGNSVSGGTGVQGVDTTAPNGIGVRGTGVYGILGESSSNTGWGVYGTNSGSGIGGYFTSTSGYALITGAGNVGIGTAAPGFPLEVNGTAAITTLLGRTTVQNANDGLYVGGTTAGTNFFIDRNAAGGQIIFGYNSLKGTAGQTTPFQIWNNVTDHVQMLAITSAGATGGNNQVLLAPTSGNVGIGTTAPDTILHVQGASAYGIARFTTSDYVTGSVGSGLLINTGATTGNTYTKLSAYSAGFSAWNNLILQSGGGSVGIGVTAPSAISALQVHGEIVADTIGGGGGQFRMISGNYGAFFRNDGSNTYLLLTASGDQYGSWNTLRPFSVSNSTGQVAFGATTNITGGYLAVGAYAGAGVSAGDVVARRASNTGVYYFGDSTSTYLYFDGGNFQLNNGSAFALMPGTNFGANLGTSANRWGCLWYNNTSLGTCASDARLKTNIQPLDFGDALTQVVNLKPRSFEFISDPNHTLTYGLIAQEVLQVAPEMVTVGSDGYYEVKYGDLQWLTLQAVQQQQIEIASLSANLANVSDVALSDTGNLNLVDQTATADANFTLPHYFTLNDALGNPIAKVGAFSDAVIANLRVGGINAQQITTQALSVATENITINGQNIKDYIASIVSNIINQQSLIGNQNVISPIAAVDQLHTNFISPVDSNASIGLKLDDNKLSVLNTNNASGSAVATIDNLGNATFSGQLSSNSLNTNDATISGILHVGKVIADEIVGASSSATYVTNVTNIYNSTPSAATNNSTDSAATNFGLIANVGTVSNSQSSMVNGQYIDISSFSGQLTYVDNLGAANATFSQNLMVFGSTSLSDTSVVGQLSVDGSLILANNSINVLGSDLNLQPLRQGGLSIMAGLFHIDTDGNLQVGGNAEFAKNVTVKGTLAAGIISPLPGNDLTVNLSSNSSSLTVLGASNAAVLNINNLGDVIASGAGTFAKLNLSLVQPALAVSPTEIVATGSAGTASIAPYKTQVTIDNVLVTDKSLIYITPTSSTNNQVLYLLKQIPDESFTVGMQNPSIMPIPFNWIIVN